MNRQILRRYVLYMFVAILLAGALTMAYDSMVSRPPGDYETERGDIHLNIGEYGQALDYFNQALGKAPDHRGALMGRALVFIQTERYPEALAELDYLINFLERTVEPDDKTGIGALAAAYANRGVVRDRDGDYEAALKDYVTALKVDEGAVSGPDLIDKILYDPRPSTVRDRARYIHEQLQLPEDQRLLSVPELDAKQRMYKP